METARTGPDAERAADRTSASGFFTRYSAGERMPDRTDEKRQTVEPEKRQTAEIEKRRTAEPVRWK